MMEYNEENLNKVITIIKRNLTIDLLPLYMRKRHVFSGSNYTYGHCHTVSGVIYKIFGPDNVSLYRGLDDEGLYHWWIVDKDRKIIDITCEQYTLLGKDPPYSKGEKASLLGFSYRDRVLILLDRVLAELCDQNIPAMQK